MLREPRYSFLENNRFSRESSYDEKQLRELFNRGRIDRETELWLWDNGNSRLAGTYESLFIQNRQFKERRLGIFGTKNCGKTAFLDCCTKFCKVLDDDSISKSSQYEISTVDFSLLHDGMAWEIRTQDYSVELKTPKINEWFAESDAILLLIDGSETIDRTEDIRLFLDQLRRRSPDGNRIDKPIAIVWTKIDLYENSNHRQEIRKLVETFVSLDSVECFSTSIFQPGKIIEPILWSVRKIDEMKYENVVRSADSISKRQILNEYRKLRDVWGINRGELGKKIDTVIDQLERERRRQFVLFAVVSNLVVFVLIFLTAIFVRNYIETIDAEHYRAALSNIKQAESRKEVETVLDDYRNNFSSSKLRLTNLEALAQEMIRTLSVRQAELAFRTAKYAIENATTPEIIDRAIEKFRNEAAAQTPEQLDELTVLATKKQKDIQFEIAADWEQSTYEKFRQYAATARTADELKRANELAKQYLLDAEKRAALRLPNRRKHDVEVWETWFDGLKREHPLELTVKTIDVPKSFFKGKNLEGKITVTLQLGKSKTTASISQLDEEQKNSDPIRFNIDLTCSIENAVWDEKKQTKISLTVAEYLEGWRYLGRSASKAVCEVTNSEYPYIEFSPTQNGVFTFQTSLSTITVTTNLKYLATP